MLAVGRTVWLEGAVGGPRRFRVTRQDRKGYWHVRVLGPPRGGRYTDYTTQPWGSVVLIDAVQYKVCGTAFAGLRLRELGGQRDER